MPSSERLRVGVVGAGIGTAHIRGYAGVPERFEVVALCDIDADRARPIAEEHHIPRLVTDLAELVRAPIGVDSDGTPSLVGALCTSCGAAYFPSVTHFEIWLCQTSVCPRTTIL